MWVRMRFRHNLYFIIRRSWNTMMFHFQNRQIRKYMFHYLFLIWRFWNMLVFHNCTIRNKQWSIYDVFSYVLFSLFGGSGTPYHVRQRVLPDLVWPPSLIYQPWVGRVEINEAKRVVVWWKCTSRTQGLCTASKRLQIWAVESWM